MYLDKSLSQITEKDGHSIETSDYSIKSLSTLNNSFGKSGMGKQGGYTNTSANFI